jgi:hypothetical protein
MSERLTRRQREEQEEYERSFVAAADADFSPLGRRLRDLGVRVFHSHREFGRMRRGGPKEVVLARKRNGGGYRQVDLGRVDGALDDVAHHGLSHLPEGERYGALEEEVNRELRRQR